VSLDDRIRAAARALDAPADLARSAAAYRQLEERYRAQLADPSSAAALHRSADGVETFLRGEKAARAGLAADADAHFATAARYGIGEPTGTNQDGDTDPLAATVAAARAADPIAVQQLLEEIQPFVDALCRAFASGSTGDRSRTIVMAVVTALPTYDPQVPFLEFVHAVAGRLLRVVRPRSADRDTSSFWTWRYLVRMRADLTRKQSDVVVLRFLLGMSVEETAEILGTTPGAVRVTQNVALARLRVWGRREPSPAAELRLADAQRPGLPGDQGDRAAPDVCRDVDRDQR
jgi:RNA polymerase sigma-70 factor (ECF subfamily)